DDDGRVGRGGEFGEHAGVLGATLGAVVPAEVDPLAGDPAVDGAGRGVESVGGDSVLGAGHVQGAPEGFPGSYPETKVFRPRPGPSEGKRKCFSRRALPEWSLPGLNWGPS